MIKKRKVSKPILALVLMVLLGATTLVFSANENSLFGSKKRISLYEEIPRPDMRRKDEPIDEDIEEGINAVGRIMPELEAAVVLNFGNEDTQQLAFEMEEEKYNIKLSEEDIKQIEKIDKTNSKKNINNYKKLLGEFDVSSKQQIELRNYFDKGCNLNDIYFAYEYLYRNYGTFDELEAMLGAREQGKDWLQIFEGYESENSVYEPMIFPKGYLDQRMKEGNLSVDDIMIADRLAQKINPTAGRVASKNELKEDDSNFIEPVHETEMGSFERLLRLRGKGVSWKSIKGDLGLLNDKSKKQRMEISMDEIHALSSKYEDLTEDEIVEALVLANTLDENAKDIILSKKAKKNDSVIFFEHLQKKYK